MTLKRTMCALLAATMLVPTAVIGEIAASAAEVDTEESAAAVSAEASYGLASNCQDGVILHCFDWKYTDIQAELKNIAEAGFTSVQTSPAQPNGSGAWYWLYQPLSFSCGTNGLGTKAELESLCQEAEKYGVKVIVDVVANHLNGDHSRIQQDLRDSQYWHTYGTVSSWSDRYQVTHGEIGMPDLATENSYVQQCVKNYILELKGMGVDGIRWDAIKHIGLPSEDDNFLPVVTDTGLYNYGEILVGPDDRQSGNEGLMKEYTNYMSVTDNSYGNDHRNRFNSGQVMGNYGNWVARGLTSDKVVYWGESHDTWANASEGDYSWNKDQNIIDRAYAAVATRNKACALYFSRPFSDPHAKENTHVGDKGSTHFTAKEVAEVNKFHNAMIGKADYYTSSNGCAVITRKGGGAVIIKGSGSGQVSVENAGGYAKEGTYTDKISGSQFTVTATTISGNIGNSGIAVIYDGEDPIPVGVSATPATGTSFTDTLTVTLNADGATNTTYKTSEGASGSYTNGQKIVVGGSTAAGSSVTVTLSGTKADGTAATASYTYTKKAPKVYPTLNGGGFVFDNSSKNWSTVNAYVYDKSGSSVVNNAAWPGAKMTDCGNGYWKYELDSKFSGSNIQVIFNNGSEQIPGAQQPGFKMSATDKKLYEESWVDLPVTSKLSVSLSASKSSVNVGDSVTLTASATGASGSVTYTFMDGSTQIQSSTSNTATFSPSTAGTHNITVTAKDSSGTATASTSVTAVKNLTDPMVTVDKASGTSFTTETMNLKLTLSNATSGTYSVDDGPAKTFTGSKTIEIGEGKIGDSTVTVKVTATNGSSTKSYTYTYEKKYVKKTSSSSSAALTEEASGAALASQYKTNAKGVGANKTITIDGSISDWSSDMLIAQGAANDDPRVYRPNSMYELPVDLYALYGAYDDNNVYLMWEMTNVQDVVAPLDDYPISQGILWQTQELPFFIAIDTGKSGDAIGNKGQLQGGGTIWNSGMTIANSFNRLISINTKGGNGPYVYSGDSTGLNPVETLGPKGTASNVAMGFGKGILSSSVTGIDGGYGTNNGRVVGDVSNSSAAWVDFNSKGHNSSSQDFFYEMSIPYSELGITKSDVTSNGIGVLVVATFGMSGMDCLPYDASMNDNADQPDTQSQENNSFEKSDADYITTSFARIGKGGGNIPDPVPDDVPLQVNFGTDRSAPQLDTTALTLKGIGYGGTAPYKYQFTVDGTVVKASNSTATYSWTPGTSGSHTLKCVITDSTGKTATVSKTFTAETGDDPVVENPVNNSTVNATSITVGNSFTMTGKATKGTTPYKYAFYYKRTTSSNWITIGTAFGSATTASFTPASAGTFDAKVVVKDANNKTATKTFTLTASDNKTLTNTSKVSTTNLTLGNTLTITGSATGGSGSYQYAYFYKRTTSDSWVTLGTQWTTATTAKLTPTGAATFDIKVVVRDKNDTSKTSRSLFTVKCVGGELTNKTTVSTTNLALGNTLVINGAATGGSGAYQYAYFYKRTTNSEWKVLGTQWTTATTAKLTPTGAATFDIKVVVRDKNNTSNTKRVLFTVKCAKQELANTSKVSSTNIKVGDTLTITGSATGGSGQYQYAYFYKRTTNSEWKVLGTQWGTATTAKLTPTGAATFDIKVVVRDKNNTSSTKRLLFTVNCTAGALANASTVNATTVNAGSKITLYGKATGGSGSYSYYYSYMRTTNTSWHTLGTVYGSATSASFTPSSAGTFKVRIIVKDNNTAETVTKTYTVTVK